MQEYPKVNNDSLHQGLSNGIPAVPSNLTAAKFRLAAAVQGAANPHPLVGPPYRHGGHLPLQESLGSEPSRHRPDGGAPPEGAAHRVIVRKVERGEGASSDSLVSQLG